MGAEVWLLLFGVILVILAGIADGKRNAKKNTERGDKLKIKISEGGFTPSNTIMGVKNLYAFSVDEKQRKIRILAGYTCRTISFEDIISVEIIENNKVFSKKSAIRTVGGAVIGGAVSGGIGAIVGGLSGSSTEEKKVSSVCVGILLKDIHNPKITIDCFNASTMTTDGKKEIKTSSMEGYIYRMGLGHANQIKDTISVIIDMIDSEASTSMVARKDIDINHSISDELQKLYDLKEKGILTESEYLLQKNKILNM